MGRDTPLRGRHKDVLSASNGVDGAVAHELSHPLITPPGLISAIGWNGPHVTTAIGFYLVTFAIVGAPGVIAVAGLLSVLQLHSAEALRGRVMSSFQTLMDGFQALGMVLAGALVAPLGLGVMLDVQAGLYVLAATAALRL